MKKNQFIYGFSAVLFCFCQYSCSKVAKVAGEEAVEVFAKKEAKVVAKKEAIAFTEKGIVTTSETTTKKTLLQSLKKERYNKFAKAVKITKQRLFVTEKNQFVNSAVYNSYLANSQNEKLLLGLPKNGTVLRKNLKKVMGHNYDKYARYEFQAHHLVAYDSGFQSTAISQRILKKYKIDINDPMNGIILPKNGESVYFGTWHNGSHVKEYHDLVAQKLQSAKSRQQCMEILDQIKQELYQGRIELYRNHRTNSLTSAFK